MANIAGVIGQVIETMPNSLYKVVFTDGKEKICYLAGKMKINKIKVLMGDSVEVVLDPHGGKTTNRIVRRLSPGRSDE